MTDRWTVHAIVVVLGLIAAIATGGGVYLTAVGRAIPQELTTLGGGALGAVSALLASTRTGGGTPSA